METWIRTYTGKRFDVFNIKLEDMCIEDIAHSLSMQCRYNGHVSEFYSVAQHCVIVSRLCAAKGLGLQGLLHDASEAYVGDVVGPIKQTLVNYIVVEELVHRAVEKKFGLDELTLDHAHVKLMDKSILAPETTALMPPDSLISDIDMVELDIHITPWSQPTAKREFLGRYHTLTGRT